MLASGVLPLDALADAVMAYEGWHVGSRSYRNRNPGNLRSSAAAVGVDADGYAVFSSLISGYTELKNDLRAKCLGNTRTGLTPRSTLAELFRVWAPSSDRNDPAAYCHFACTWLTSATGHAFTPDSTLDLICPLGSSAPESSAPGGSAVSG